MTTKTMWLILLVCICHNTLFAQIAPQRKMPAQRFAGSIKIDGVLNEEAWKVAPVATGLVEMRPTAGRLEDPANKTEVYILYDNNSIYVGGYCHELSSDSIARELVGRDVVGSNDFIGIIFDTYNDKINAFGFYVTPLSEQFDAKYSSTNGEDGSWSAVWYSEAKIVKDGWTFEMRIPYSALRFSPKGTDWGMNITRRRNKTGQQYTWNFVSPTISGFVNQEGLWTGISNIKPPVRLSFSPYLSANVNHYPFNIPGVKNTSAAVNGGMDIKYGINQNYTLDMTLIPDFGQVQSDKLVNNTTPFEVKYDENRPFFTEGTELFNKGGLFYSKRVGGEPIYSGDARDKTNPNEQVIDNPTESKLLNATKISGRNSKGLGIGFFNAITQTMYAEVEDTLTHLKRKVETGPLTNYNIMVLDQTLKNNSSVSLINTNTLREGANYDANVTAGMIDLNNKKNTYNFYAKIAISNLSSQGSNLTGYSHYVGYAKTGGRFNFTVSQELANERYEINDLGYLSNNDFLNHYMYLGYKWIKPTSKFNNVYLNYNFNLSHRFSDQAFQSLNINVNGNSQLKNLWGVGAYIAYNANGNDFYEPRANGTRVFKTGQSYVAEVWGSTNSAKKYYADADFSYTAKDLFNGKTIYIGVGQRYRFNNKFSLATNFTYNPSFNNAGFSNFSGNDIIFNKRRIKTSENTFTVKYSFSKKSGLSMIARHYWSQLTYKQSYLLNNDGSLTYRDTYAPNTGVNVNFFNIDMVYTWQFGPGSFVNIVWKNAIREDDLAAQNRYFKNFSETINAPQNNNISIKIIYYLDYLSLKKKK